MSGDYERYYESNAGVMQEWVNRGAGSVKLKKNGFLLRVAGEGPRAVQQEGLVSGFAALTQHLCRVQTTLTRYSSSAKKEVQPLRGQHQCLKSALADPM